MSRLLPCFIAVLMTLLLLADTAAARVLRKSVTPASVREKDSQFSVKAEKRKDGLIHFTITYRLPKPLYVVAHFDLRDGETTLVKTATPGFVREDSATFHVALSPRHLAGSKFELSHHSFSESGGQPVVLPGGTSYDFELEAFGKDAPAAKAD